MFFARHRLKRLLPLLCIIVGAIVAAPLFLLSNHIMLMTSTPRFCSSCHEIEPAYRSWKDSTHCRNKSGVVALCKDCHLPPLEDTISFYWAKTYHGTKDITLHLLGGKYDREAMKVLARQHIPNSRCLRCHAGLLDLNSRGARKAHMTCFWPKPGNRKRRCIECHENLVHTKKVLFRN